MSKPLNRRCFLAYATGLPVAWATMSQGGLPDARTHVVEIVDLAFNPPILNVSIGDTVKWVNHDLSPHTATASDDSWDTQELVKGQSGEIEITAATFPRYFCAYHPSMEGEFVISSG